MASKRKLKLARDEPAENKDREMKKINLRQKFSVFSLDPKNRRVVFHVNSRLASKLGRARDILSVTVLR